MRQLSAAMAGRPAEATDWLSVLELANEHLITPQLHAALVGADALQRAPADLRRFTAEVVARNRERNRRLFEQLREAVAALNTAGLEPVLLKGAALWAHQGSPANFDRMLYDLDLLVPAADAPKALLALTGAGFQVLAQYDDPSRHVVAELGRPRDVGLIDLHRRPPGPLKSALIPQGGRRIEWQGVSAIAPQPAEQVLMLALHDQFHEGGYWRGDLPLRHLLDIAALAPEVDWNEVERLAGERLTLRAVAVEVAAAHWFTGTPPAWPAAARLSVRIQRLRQLVQFAWPATVRPLAWAAALGELSSLVGGRRLVGDGPGGIVGRFARFRALTGGPV